MIKFISKSKKWGGLSNMGGSGFWIKQNGVAVWMNCNEIFYNLCKTVDLEERRKISNCRSGFEARKLGKVLTLREDWDSLKLDVMRYGLCRKFKNVEMRALLLSTGTEKLVENAPWDEFWGCGRNGNGKNWMGRLLMELRDGKDFKLSGTSKGD